MTKAKVPEDDLQKWFVAAAKSRALHGHIENVKELAAWADRLKAANRSTEVTTRTGVDRAVRVCNALCDADHLSERKSIAAGARPMYPDLVLTSASGHYILVELKTMPDAEREGVQELLAYSASIKMQMPYVNDFMFIIVARHWNPLLEHAVRALIMDGKHVLPLEAHERGGADAWDFSLSVRLDMFEFNFVQYFDPWHAFVPADIGVYRPVNWRGAAVPAVDQYLRQVLRSAVADASRLHQTGFGFFWTKRDGYSDIELGCSTIVTVNQHWREGESLDGWYPRPWVKKRGFPALHQKVAVGQRKPAPQAATDDIWTQAAENAATTDVYKQSSLSYELLERYRNRQTETKLSGRVSGLHEFDVSGSYFHLDMFMEVWKNSPLIIKAFVAFGELADFARDESLQIPLDLAELRELIDAFYAHKKNHPDVLPDRYTPEEVDLMRMAQPRNSEW